MPVVWWLLFLHVSLFVLGCAVGSFLNVCIYRMATGRSVSWPGSHCGACLRPIPGKYNVPLLTYLLLGGRCAMCGARFSSRYFFVELLTGVVFAGLFALEVGANWQRTWPDGGWSYLTSGLFPPDAAPYYLAHVFLASVLIVAVGALADGADVPPVVVAAGAVVGFAFALTHPNLVLSPTGLPRPLNAVVAVWLMPAVARLTGAGRGTADVALLAGGFLGWQPVAVALLGAVILRSLGAGLVSSAKDGIRCLDDLEARGRGSVQFAQQGFGPGLAQLLPVVWLIWPLRAWWLHPEALLLLSTAAVLALARPPRPGQGREAISQPVGATRPESSDFER